MNLGEYLAKTLLEAGDQPEQTIALFPGSFKPPHKGHFEVVEKLLKTADQVVILVSPKIQDGITSDESIAVWDLYKPLFDGSVEVKVTPDPIKEVFEVVEQNPDTNFVVALGNKHRNIEQYSNVKVFDAGEVDSKESTELRMALLKDDEEEIKKHLPEKISIDQFLLALGKQPTEKKPEETTPPPAKTSAEKPSTEEKPAEETPEQPLTESPPINFDEPPYQDYIAANRRKIEAAAAVFNIPIPDMEHAFNGGTEVVLNDDMWKEMENTKSYNTKTLSDAIAHALKIGIDPKPYIDAIKKQDEIPLPLVLQWQQGKYYMVGGEVILSIYRSLGVIPTVLLGTLNLQTKTLPEPLSEGLKKDRSNTIKSFVKYAINELGIQKPPSGLTLSHNNDKAKTRHTFGTFDPNNDKIWLYVKNRNMADILRTLAHELVHRKQAEDGRIEQNSGDTGSEIENEANAMAGILLRKFGKANENIYESLKKFNTPDTLSNRLYSQLYELKVNEITLNPSSAVEIDGDTFEGTFKVGDIEYEYSIDPMDNPYKDGEFFSISFTEKGTKKNIPTGNAKENYIKILSTMFKIILDFAKEQKPEYIGISSLDKSGYGNIYNNLTKTNKIPGYSRKDAGLDFKTKLGDKGQFVVLKRVENTNESKKKFGNYLFGDKESGVKIGWYNDEMEVDTPSEKKLFDLLKKYADSEASTYSNISLDDLIPVFKKIRSQYPEIGEAKVNGYIYRGTSIPEEKLTELEDSGAKTESYNQGYIILDQTYSSRRQVQSWSTEYFPAAGFAVTTAERKGGRPVIMRAKASDADLYFNPKFMEKLSTQLEDETFNIIKPIPVDIMVIENYQDEFEDIESGYLHTKQ